MIEYIGIADVIKLSFYKFVTLIASRSSWFYWIGIDFLYWNSILDAKFEKHEDANKFAAIEVGLDNEIYWVWKWKKISKICHLAIFKIRFADNLPINPTFMKWALSFSLSIFTIICFLSIEMKTKIKEINEKWETDIWFWYTSTKLKSIIHKWSSCC